MTLNLDNIYQIVYISECTIGKLQILNYRKDTEIYNHA